MELIIRAVNARTLSILPHSHCLHVLPLGAVCYLKGCVQVCQGQKSLITLFWFYCFTSVRYLVILESSEISSISFHLAD